MNKEYLIVSINNEIEFNELNNDNGYVCLVIFNDAEYFSDFINNVGDSELFGSGKPIIIKHPYLSFGEVVCINSYNIINVGENSITFTFSYFKDLDISEVRKIKIDTII